MATVYLAEDDGSGDREVLYAGPFPSWTTSWSNDGTRFAFYGGPENQ